jgi:preprotein translocase subunit SecE
MSKITNFLKETRMEMNNVKWPTRKQTIGFTVAVLAVSVFVAYYLGLFDFIFKQGLEKLLNR